MAAPRSIYRNRRTHDKKGRDNRLGLNTYETDQERSRGRTRERSNDMEQNPAPDDPVEDVEAEH